MKTISEQGIPERETMLADAGREQTSRTCWHASPGHIEIPQLWYGGQPPTDDQRRFTMKAVARYSTKVRGGGQGRRGLGKGKGK